MNKTDKDHIAGAAKQAEGTMATITGKIAGSTRLANEGQAEKAEGAAQSAAATAQNSPKK